MQDNDQIIDEVTSSDYKYGFTTDIDTETIGKGLSEETVRLISEKKGEPEWLLQFRLEAYRHWLTLEQPDWALLKIPPIDYQDIIYYAAPKKKEGPEEPRRGRSGAPAHLREARYPPRGAEDALRGLPSTRSWTPYR